MNRAGWPIVQIGDYLKVVAGPSFRSAEFVEGEDHIRLLRGDNIVQGKLRWDGVKRWHGDVQKRYHLEENDVVIAMDRPWIEAGLKWAWIQQKDLPAYLVQRVARLRATEGLDQKFLRYVIASPDFTAYIKPIVTGATVPHISGGQIESHRFPIPPLPTQRKIAAILSAYDDLIENNTRRVRVLEDMARALYREWFVEYRYPGHEQDEFVEDEQGRRPEGWEWLAIKDVAPVVTRGVAPKYTDDSDDLVINQKCIRDQRLNLIPARRHSSKVPPIKVIRFGDVLINSTGVGTLGRVAQVYQETENLTVDTHVTIVRADPTKMDLDYFGLVLMGLQSEFEAAGVGSTGQTELGRERIGMTALLVPPLQLQADFGMRVQPMRRLVEQLLLRNANLRRTRDLLLPRLVSGELDVSGLDIRGAAEELVAEAEAVA
ncbi:restriction endonuclease subunit S [Deinococcus marmoris]|uniref:restriction endonuclease subunit S n=1 Tax=Deinococcus marmoris TaxID=249408 RepID=UPI000A9D4900|nr:restriction endonuclease subunit S [Deinococcus marmoris]